MYNMIITVKVRRLIGGMYSGMPNAPVRLSSCGGASAAGRMKVYLKSIVC